LGRGAECSVLGSGAECSVPLKQDIN
jgi:hypothetical protein